MPELDRQQHQLAGVLALRLNTYILKHLAQPRNVGIERSRVVVLEGVLVPVQVGEVVGRAADVRGDLTEAPENPVPDRLPEEVVHRPQPA